MRFLPISASPPPRIWRRMIFLKFSLRIRFCDTCVLSARTSRKGIIGGGNDGGLDSTYLFINGHYISGDVSPDDFDAYKKNVVLDLVLIQSKRESTFKEAALPKIKQTLSDAFDPNIDAKQLKVTYNSGVIEAIQRFRVARRALQASGAQINIHVFYVCKGDAQEIHPKIGQKQKDSLLSMVENTVPGNRSCDVLFLGSRELADLASKIPPTKRTLVFDQLMMIKGGGFFCLVTLAEYNKFITESGELLRYLFESNVRDYLEDMDVNKDIRESLKTPSEEDFWVLNNGITVLAEEVSPGPDTLIIEDPQIVNGLQTSEEIFNYGKTAPNPEHLKRRVSVKVATSTSAESQDRIIKATNRQTGITAAQLHATEQVHRDIERVFPANGMFYDRRLKYWKYKDKPRDQVVSIQELSQCLMAIYEQRPDTARARPGDVFSKKKTDVYKKLFSPDTSLDFYVRCAQLQRIVDTFLRASGLSRALVNDIKFYVSMIASVLVVGKKHPSTDDLAKMEANQFSAEMLHEAFVLAETAYGTSGGDQDAAKGTAMLAEIKCNLGIT